MHAKGHRHRVANKGSGDLPELSSKEPTGQQHMSKEDFVDRREKERREPSERRKRGRDRRSGKDRRKEDLGPGAVGLTKDRRTGWDRRISDRRSRAKHRREGDRRVASLDYVALNTGRWLVSRLYRAARSHDGLESTQSRLGEARTEILKVRPDLDFIGAALKSLKNTAIAKFPEYELAEEVLGQITVAQSQKQSTKGKKAQPLRASLQRLPALVAAPLETRVGNEFDGAEVVASKASRKRKSVKKARPKARKAAKKATKKKATKKRGR